MNIRQGFFRLWVIASVLFVITVALVSYRGIREEFRIAGTDYDAIAKEVGGYSQLPTICGLARGSAGTDYENRNGLCWYKNDDFRRLYPEYNDISDRTISEKLYAKAGQPLKRVHPWHKVTETIAIAACCPLAVLILGWSFGWAVAGFRR